ncbi:CaiB/BaiF CoA transferase family protein [Cytobacillus purgationiresistens]|uniref:Crotonobetainyl-CoA:carnitine CoA-transferase CaiB-like acyl-CoA transferase n=1 Tax=Cytobacillus purgationiresistens TaxID=863449 RepID=A0ABU0AJW5_9BACI|nr:CoA transferase [Cytobacillus purgationiresistens]MDQ0270350.1 crotonobetainyl-CoA:carnitine CoA-transferase CaiB-like acyl-CoA transferase [Cytobacillus purgationiresistens]
MLKGIRVIDFSQYLPAPHTTLRLADLGAEVIKVESPTGDPSRAPSGKEDMGYVFLAQNRNKKSVALNLKEEADRDAALQLIASADIVIESYRPGVADRLGIGYEDALKVKKDIIYCSLSGYGGTEVMRHLGGHDLNYLAISGLLSQLKDENGRPIQPGTQLADFIGGITASEAILGALVNKERTGEPSYLDVSLTDSVLPLMSNHILIESLTGEQNGVAKLGGKHVCYFIYETKDGRYVSLGALELKFWRNFCYGLHKESWLTEHYSLASDENPIFTEMKAVFASRTLDEWAQFSLEVDCCLAPILETAEVVKHPLFKSRQFIFNEEGVNYTSTRFTEEAQEFTRAPQLDQHANELKQTK